MSDVTARSTLYKHVSQLTEGGVGRVELALRRDENFQRLYAVKRLHRHFAADDDFRTMFLDEAKLAGLIRHPNVVPVLDVGEDEDGPFLVMEYIEGLALSSVVGGLDSPIPVQVGLRMIAQAARGLHAAHELKGYDGQAMQVVHRDVSPQNILVSFDGNVLVTDFGIAKALGRRTRTSTGILKGKFGYMSPEQLRFEKVDRRADLFSLGIVLYELLTGTRLYRNNEDNEGLRRILHEAPPDIGLPRPDVPSPVVQLTFELLAKSREKRPGTAEEVARRLEDAALELADEEGPLEIRDFMEDRFSRVRTARAAGLEEALRVATQPSIAPDQVVAATAGHRPGNRNLARRAAIVGTIAALAATAWTVFRSDADSPATVRTTERRTATATMPETVALEPGPTNERSTAPPSPAPSSDTTTNVVELSDPRLNEVPRRPRSARRARRRREHASRSPTSRPAHSRRPVRESVGDSDEPPESSEPAPPVDNTPRSAIPSLGWDER